jgi:hypothetical protein
MTPAAPEFSRPFALESLGHEAATRRLEASAAERAALARRFDLLALDRLEAEVTLRWTAGGVLRLDGRLRAAATQRCVVTLEPVPQAIDEPFVLRYSRHAEAEAEDGDGESGFDPDAPEPLPAAGLDLGEEVAQALSLALDPYPRAPGASLATGGEDDPGGAFAQLRALKPRS